MNSALVEALQIMKAYYKHDRVFDFVAPRYSNERELTINKPERDHLAELTAGTPASLETVFQAINSEEGVADTDD